MAKKNKDKVIRPEVDWDLLKSKLALHEVQFKNCSELIVGRAHLVGQLNRDWSPEELGALEDLRNRILETQKQMSAYRAYFENMFAVCDTLAGLLKYLSPHTIAETLGRKPKEMLDMAKLAELPIDARRQVLADPDTFFKVQMEAIAKKAMRV